MIKVERIEQPKELTDEVQRKLTEEFMLDQSKSVWNKKYIREKLLEECNNKCVYCESLIGDGKKEMHIDHFHCKNKYQNEVVMWNNLNPSCPHCNKSKSTHDTYEEPIINPFEQDPRDYFYLKNYRYYSKNKKADRIANTTIDVLGLNDTDKIVKIRFTLGEALLTLIEDVYTFAEEELEKTNNEGKTLKIKIKNRIIRGCRNILKKGIKEAEYAAFMATLIKDSDYYKSLKALLQENGLWDEELQNLDEAVEKIKMQTSRDIQDQIA